MTREKCAVHPQDPHASTVCGAPGLRYRIVRECSRVFAEELGAAAVERGVGEFGAGDDFGGDEDGGSLGKFAGKGDGDAHGCGDEIGAFGLEAEAAAGHVDARDNVVAKGFAADAGDVVDPGAAMDASVGGHGAHGLSDGLEGEGGRLGRFRGAIGGWRRIEDGNGGREFDRLEGIRRLRARCGRGMGLQ